MSAEQITHENYAFYGVELENGDETYQKFMERYAKYYDKRGKHYKRIYLFLTFFRIVMVAGIPILALSQYPVFNPYILTALSSLALIADGILNVTAAHDKWKSYRRSCDRICQEHRLFVTGTGVYDDKTEEEMRKLYVTRCEMIISEEGEAWEQYIDKSVNER